MRALLCAAVAILAAGSPSEAGAETEAGTGAAAEPKAAPEAGTDVQLAAVLLDGSTIKLDGAPIEEVWQRAAVVDKLTRLEPVEGGPSFGKVEWRTFYDKEALYFSVRVQHPPGVTRAHITTRDDIGNDDTVNVYINPYPGTDGGYVFRTNPLGVQRDLLVLYGNINDSWDGIWQSAGMVLPDGYSVEMRIPFRTLRFARGQVHEWGLGLAVNTAARAQVDFWPAVTVDRGSEFVQLARFHGLRGIEPGYNLELLASVGARHGGTAQPDGPFEWDERDPIQLRGQGILDVGADLRYGITPGITANLTINPDFSQIEADADQLDYNIRYPLLLPEKRPFFLEGVNNFDTPIPLLYTRSINDPIAGIKVTGKESRYTIGVLSIWDQDPPCIRDPEPRCSRIRFDPTQAARATEFDDLTGKDAVTSVARVAMNVGEGSHVGAFVATKQAFDRATNALAGEHELAALDTRLRLGEVYFLTGQAGFSRTTTSSDPGDSTDSDDVLGGFYLINARRTDRRLSVEAESSFYSTGFRAETSELSRVGYLSTRALASYKVEVNDPRLWFVRPELEAKMIHDAEDFSRLDWLLRAATTLQLGDSAQLVLDYSHGEEFYNGLHHPVGLGSLLYSAAPWTWLVGSAQLTAGKRINYDPMDTFLGTVLEGNLTLTLRPTVLAQIDLSYIKSLFWRDLDEDVLEKDVDLARFKLQYNFDTRWSARLISQLNTDRQSLQSSLLIAYEYSPGTAFFVGYQDAEPLGDAEPPDPSSLVTVDRRAFVKFSYAWAL